MPIILTFLVLFFGLLDPAFSKDYSIEELLKIAEENSDNIKSAQSLAEAQKSLANQQKYWDNPVVEYKNGLTNNVQVSQNIPYYNKLQSRFDIENSEYQALEAQKNNVVLQVKSETFRLIYQYQIIKKRIELAKKRLKRLELVNKFLANLVLTSPTKKAQWFITKDKIKLVERDLILFENDLVQTWNKANIFLHLDQPPAYVSIDWLDKNNYQGRQFYQETALQNNLDLLTQKNLIKKSKSALEYAKIEQMPDFKISGFTENSSGSRSSSNNGIGLSLSIPLINRNQEKILSSNSSLKSQQYSYEFQKQQLIKNIDNNLNQYETLMKISEQFPVKNLQLIVNRLEQANEDFKKGILDFITYIELDSQEYQIVDATINAQIDLARSYGELMNKIGFFVIPNTKK
jgi:outer membrane protein TolC